MTDEIKKPLPSTIEEWSKSFNDHMTVLENEQEQFWNNLSKEDQLKAFCAVSRRIFDGEIKVKGTYRYVLYDVFGFGPEAYAQAQLAGYLAIHNSIMEENHDFNILTSFCKKHNIEDYENKVVDYLI